MTTPEHRCSISPALAAEMEAAREHEHVWDEHDICIGCPAERSPQQRYSIKPPKQHSLSAEDIRLTRARALAHGHWPQGLSATGKVLADLVDYVEEQRKSVTEMAPSPTEALLAAARAVLAAAEPTPACWCGSETHRDAEGVWCYRDINHDVSWQAEAPAERPEETR